MREGLDFYVYALLDPRKGGTPFYVGKGRGRRAMDHMTAAHSGPNRHKQHTIAAIRRSGMSVDVAILERGLDETSAFRIECDLITLVGRRDLKTGPLTNLTNGGEGQRGAKFTVAHRQAMSASRKANLNGMFGRKHTTAARAAMSAARLSRPSHKHSDAHKQALRESNPGGIAVARPVSQVSEDGGVVKVWTSSSAAAKALGLWKGNIHSCASRRHDRRTGGFFWRFAEVQN